MPGRVKTRLIPALGPEGAAALAARMLADTLAEAIAAGTGPVELCADPGPAQPDWQGLIPAGVEASAQGAGGLGTRLSRAARRALKGGEPALLVGTDCPSLDRARLRAAARVVESGKAIIHPAMDGGYVLLGLVMHHPSIFAGIAWSGPDVAADTIARFDALGWPIEIAEALRDVDEPGDLA